MKNLYVFVLILCSILLCNCKKTSTKDLITIDPVPVVLPEITKTFDITYGTLHTSQKVDVYTPKAVAPFPVVVLIHGGGWVQGDKMEYRTSIKTEALLAKGYAVVAVNYRLSGVAKFPAQIQDVKAAVRWIRANAATYKFNPDKIGAWGTSAGGHLTALLATSGGINALEDFTQGDATKSSTIQAAVDWFGPTDFLLMDAQTIAQGCNASNATHNGPNSPESSLMGYPIQTQPTLVQLANPITYVTANDPPMYIAHGLGDCTVPRAQSQILYDALLVAKGATDIRINMLSASGHGTGQFENLTFVNQMVDFFDSYFK
jgi:acetyl esterase/lipase